MSQTLVSEQQMEGIMKGQQMFVPSASGEIVIWRYTRGALVIDKMPQEIYNKRTEHDGVGGGRTSAP